MTNHPTPTTDATMKEKVEVLRNDARVRSGSTFRDHTHDDEGGRYAKPTNVIGSESVPQYPVAAPNWAADPCGAEPPLGIDVNAIDPCGEQFEVEASCDAAALPQRAVPHDACEPASSQGDVVAQPATSPANTLAAVDAPLAVTPWPDDVDAPAAIPNSNPPRRPLR